MVDSRGKAVHLEGPPRRIVSLVPSQTELLAHLELDDEVVGLTRFCVHPSGWKARKTIVGGTKNVDVERVRALAPDLVIANREENVREQVEAIEAFAPVYVTDVATVDDALAMIRDLGRLTGRAERGALTATLIEAAFAELDAFEPLRTAYLIWREPYMSVGADTIIHDVMLRGGFENVFGDRTRYPEVTPDDLRTARPDLVLLSSEPYPFSDRHVEELSAHLPGVRIRLVDGEPFSWYGSRLLNTAAYLQRLRSELG